MGSNTDFSNIISNFSIEKLVNLSVGYVNIESRFWGNKIKDSKLVLDIINFIEKHSSRPVFWTYSQFHNFDFCNIRFKNIIFHGCIFENCDFKNACFENTSFERCDGWNLRNGNTVPMKCPEKGSFIGYKKCLKRYYYEIPVIVKLEIPKNAKRCSALSNKCRCNVARVLGFYDLDGKEISINDACSRYNHSFIYRKNEFVIPNGFDEDRFRECSEGIHFFMTFEEAKDY